MDFDEFKNRFQKAPVRQYPHEVPEKPVVSVCIQTYQHADFIDDCLEGILMQEVDFDYEILLGEDDSSDGTREICIEYAEKYPGKIRLFLHSRENNISVFGRPTGRFNFLYNLFSARGTYIALCEGDDYWTDPLKLQKQVDFLEQHRGYSLCTGGYLKKYDGDYSEVIQRNIVARSQKDEKGFTFDLKDAAEVWLTKTLTILFRKIDYAFDTPFRYQYFRDVHLYHNLLQSGKGYYFQEVLGVYNIHAGGIESMKEERSKRNDHYQLSRELYENSPDPLSRVMNLRAALGLLHFNMKASGDPSAPGQVGLVKEIFSLIRSPQDFKWVLKEFTPPKIKEEIKGAKKKLMG